MAKTTIEKTIQSKIKSLEKQMNALQSEAEQWKKVLADYDKNRTTIESILNMKAPSDAPRRGRRPKAK